MVKAKNKKTNSKAIYLKYSGAVWIILTIIALSNIKTLNIFETFTGRNAALSLLSHSLLLLPGVIGLAYGIILAEHKPDLKPLQLQSYLPR